MRNAKKLFLLVALTATLFAPGAFAGGEKEAQVGKKALRFWAIQAPAMNAAYSRFEEEYENQHPDIDITMEIFDYDSYIQTLQTAFPSGTEADILMMFGTWVKSYSERLAVVPESVMKPADAKESFLGATLGGYLFDDTLYGIPQEFNIEYGMLLLNKEIAENAGIDWSKGWSSWDALIGDLKKTVVTTDDVMTRAGLGFCTMDGIAYTFLSLLKQYGGSPMNEDETAFTFNTDAGRKALLHMKRLVDEGLVDPILFNDLENFSSDAYFGEIMTGAIIGPWVIADYAEDYPDVVEKSTYVRLPSVGASTEFVAASGWGLTVSKKSPYQDEAWDFIRYVAVDKDNALKWNIGTATLPALKQNTEKPAVNALLEKHPYLAGHMDLIPHGVYQGHMPDSDMVLYDIMYNAVLNMLQGNAGIDETLSLIQEQASATLH